MTIDETYEPNLLTDEQARLPRLNLTLIRELIRWAQRDETAFSHYADWFADWNQATWGSVDPEYSLVAEEWPSPQEWHIGIGTEHFVKTRAACGTAYCMAGGAAVASDYRLLFDTGGNAETCVRIEPDGVDEKGRTTYRDVGKVELVDQVAQRLLGITNDEAVQFFEGDNEIGHLMEYANEFSIARGGGYLYDPDEIGDWLE